MDMLQEAVLRTVAYFDLFDFPLTRGEVWRWLYDPEHGTRNTEHSIGDIDAAISTLISEGKFKEENGCVFLAHRMGLPAVRSERYRHSVRKWRRARRWAMFFGALPGVLLVGVGNTLAYHNAKDESDIDFFIVTKPGTLWRTRFLCAASAALSNLRPAPGKTRDKLCLSFFVSEDALDLSKLMIQDSPTKVGVRPGSDRFKIQDPYLTYWTAQMTPLVSDRATLERYREKNEWVRAYLPNTLSRDASPAPPLAGPAPFWLYRLFQPLDLMAGNFLEHWQRSHFPPSIMEARLKNDGSVVVTDEVLKFHVNDRRVEIMRRWEVRIHCHPDESRGPAGFRLSPE